jgi:hypothetical protein
MPIKEVGDPIRHNAAAHTCSTVLGNGLGILREHCTPVIAHHTHVDSSGSSTQILHRLSSRANRIIYSLHEHSLLGIDSFALRGLNVEEGVVEARRIIVQEVRRLHITSAVMLGILVVDSGCQRRFSGIVWSKSRGSRSNSHSLDGVLEPPGKRQALPMIAMGSVGDMMSVFWLRCEKKV